MNINNIYTILIVDDEKDYRDTLALFFESEGYSTKQAQSAEEALLLSQKEYFPIVVTDIMMDHMSGIDLLKELKSYYHDEVEVIILTGYGSIETAVETLKMGAFGYFIKSQDPKELLTEVGKAVACLELRKKAFFIQQDEDMLLSSLNPEMGRIWGLIDKIADSNANVLITGESGTGKEIVAQRIHSMSKRKAQPFIAINCQSLSSHLIESELFGHEKGAFTGANEKRIGKLEQCSGGTVFLDEIGDMNIETQIKLLRVLETKTIERVGSNKSILVDFRVVSATNKLIEEELKIGNFREDLLYRINTFEIKLPPLRQRREDLPEFIKHFIHKFSKETGKVIRGIEAQTNAFLLDYDYPGNIRELKNMIERLVILSGQDGILRMHQSFDTSLDQSQDTKYDSYRIAKQKFERKYILDILESVDGNITQAAQKMELSRRQLFNKIKELEIKEQ